MKKRGGPRRQKVPPIEMEHLASVLTGYVKRYGVESSFQFRDYFHLTKPMAVNGLALKDQVDYVEAMSQVNEELSFRFSDLKEVFSQVCKQFPTLKEQFSLELRQDLPLKLSNATMTIMTHVRRLKDKKKFVEATKHLSHHQTSLLERLRALVVEGNKAEEEHKEEVAATATGSQCSDEDFILTQDVLDLDVPETPMKKGRGLLEEALEVSPVPPRKKVIKQVLKRPAAREGCKKSEEGMVAGSHKKPASKDSKKKKKKKASAGKDLKASYKVDTLLYMPYKKKGHMAIRFRNGPQLLVVSQLGSMEKNKEGAKKCMNLFAKGKILKEVLDYKDSLGA
eukprot:s1056_g18.t1